jgi:alcohol dehydrogenase class IV
VYLPSFDEFLFPSRTTAGPGASGRVGAKLRAMGVPPGRVLVVVDRAIHDTGLDRPLLDGLHASGYDAAPFPDVSREPQLEDVERIAAHGDPSEVVAVVGIGGGSALDTAKLVAYRTATGESLAHLKGPVADVAGFPPLVLIPTTVGTGAEATRVAMITVDGAKRIITCAQFSASLAVLDAALVAQLPPPVIASTALDALSHCLESMMSTSAHDLTWHFAAKAARIVLERLPAAYEGTSDAARGDLLYASFLAGVALNAGVVLGHSLSYVLATRHNLAHGTGCALALPYTLAYNRGMDAARAEQIVSAVLGEPRGLWELARTVEQLNRRVGIPSNLESLGGTADELHALAERVVVDYPRPTNPVPLAEGRVQMLLEFMHKGDLAGAWSAMGTGE